MKDCSAALSGAGHVFPVEASLEYRMRQCRDCQIAGIWIEFHPGGAGSSADGALPNKQHNSD